LYFRTIFFRQAQIYGGGQLTSPFFATTSLDNHGKWLLGLGVVHKWRHAPRKGGVYDIVMMCDVGGAWRHARHICGKAWPGSRGW